MYVKEQIIFTPYAPLFPPLPLISRDWNRGKVGHNPLIKIVTCKFLLFLEEMNAMVKSNELACCCVMI
jgi:hypothetical protein